MSYPYSEKNEMYFHKNVEVSSKKQTNNYIFTMAMTSTSGHMYVSKQQFIMTVENNLDDIYHKMNELRDISVSVSLTVDKLEEAFNCLYDAKDMLDFYAIQMKTNPENDVLLKKGWNWVKNYMSDLVEYGVGDTAELRRITNFNLKSQTGEIIGQGDEIRVIMVPECQRHKGVILRNWMEIDRCFWMKDHDKTLEEHQRSNIYRNYDDDYDWRY